MANHTPAYQPVSCEQHSFYELAVMQHKTLSISWRDTQGNQQENILIPFDVQTQKGEEYLLGHDKQKKEYRIRLDMITQCRELT